MSTLSFFAQEEVHCTIRILQPVDVLGELVEVNDLEGDLVVVLLAVDNARSEGEVFCSHLDLYIAIAQVLRIVFRHECYVLGRDDHVHALLRD